MKTALINALRLLAGRRPRLAFSVARVLAWLSRPLGRGIPEETLAEVFPHLPPRALRAARQRTWSNFLQIEALNAALARDGRRPAYPRILAESAVADLRPPAILASFHIGAFPATGAALERLPGEVLVLHQGRYAPRPGLTLLQTGDDEWDRARALHRAVTTLRSDGYVFLAMDGFADGGRDYGSAVDVPMLGGSVSLARGGFALARIAGAPIVPVVARWRGSGAEITCGQPIPPAEEEQTAAAAARWLERYLLEFPGEISSRTLAILKPRHGFTPTRPV